MLGKKGESLESKFKLSYSILFNALSSQIVQLEDIMKKSFGENQNFLQLKSLKQQKEKLEKRVKTESIQCTYVDIEDVAPIYAFKKNADQLYTASMNYFSHFIVAKKLRLYKFAEIIDDDYNYHLVVLERFELVRGSKYDVEYYTGTMVVPLEHGRKPQIYLQGMKDARETLVREGKRITHAIYNMWFLPQEIVRVFDSRVPNMSRYVCIISSNLIIDALRHSQRVHDFHKLERKGEDKDGRSASYGGEVPEAEVGVS